MSKMISKEKCPTCWRYLWFDGENKWCINCTPEKDRPLPGDRNHLEIAMDVYNDANVSPDDALIQMAQAAALISLAESVERIADSLGEVPLGELFELAVNMIVERLGIIGDEISGVSRSIREG